MVKKPQPSVAAPAAPAPGAADAATETRILDAAHTVFTRRGTAGARMTEIAREAGVNHALVHYYFRSKQRLAEAVFRRAAIQLFPPMLAVLASDLPLDEKVRRVASTVIDMLLRNRYLPGYLLAELNHYPERAEQLLTTMAGIDPAQVRPRLVGRLAAQLEEEAHKGTIRPITPQDFVLNLVSMIVYPFAARPLVLAIVGLDDAAFAALMERRKTDVPAFFLAALRP
ncbi:MAG TPA: helix-turn-helix domain-containing protein [Gemmatimonadaceae bacterium]|jgi:AcrR family transcriptional regulator|nr:helix-turn-helix domain-containing protein [Gemmatimonadaceae bacterium]